MTGSGREKLVAGCLVRWQPHGILGCVEQVEHRQADVVLDNGDRHRFALDALERVDLGIGTQVTAVGSDQPGVIVRPIPGTDRPTWEVAFPGRVANVPESGLRPAILRDPLARMRNGDLGKADDFNLRSVAADLWTQHLHSDLVSLAHARVDLKPHQVGVVHRVITNYPHRFLLCDEVGLGKTIEAAMIVKELRARKQTQRVLILVPSGLQRQWQFELKTKFNETFAIYNGPTIAFLKAQGIDHPWTSSDLIITSHSWASWDEQRREEIAAVDWDLIIVDEAHHAREQRQGNKVQRTNLYRLVRELVARPEQGRRAALFLTATPMQLQHHELYSLVEMLDPILFSSEADFAQHIANRVRISALAEQLQAGGFPSDEDELDEMTADLADYLKLSDAEAVELVAAGDAAAIAHRLESAHRLSEVLIRNRRAAVGGFQPRSAYRWPVTPTEEEREIYRLLQEVLDRGYRAAQQSGLTSLGFLMATLQKLAASSSRALLASLQARVERMFEPTGASPGLSVGEAEERLDADDATREIIAALAPDAAIDASLTLDLIALLSRIEVDSKALTLRERLGVLFHEDSDAKVLIFTQFRETQGMLKALLEEMRWGVHLFHGQLNPLEKDRAVDAFRVATGPQILVSTEAGGEGRNFQFCHFLVNYDLPWNPMKVEQRIGRVDRIGQQHPVVVFNLFVEGTIEERVLDVLEHRIQLFTEAVGGLEPIIGEIEADIRKALRLAGEARERQLALLADRVEASVQDARTAERQMADLILDARSYGAEIRRLARGAAEQVTQADYERFLKGLLASANTYVATTRDPGVYKLEFHAPFTVEHPELFRAGEQFRACFDPRQSVDAQFVEYMGFGHPIIDTLVECCMGDWREGRAAGRRVADFPLSGWQFNWLITEGAVRPRRFVHPTFVADDGTVDRDRGHLLLQASRALAREETPVPADQGSLETAHEKALSDAGALINELARSAEEAAAKRGDTERARIEALYEYRKQAAADRLESTRVTLARLQASSRSEDRAVVPIWRANVERAEAELSRIEQDRNEMLADLARRLRPALSYELLNMARIVGVPG